MKSNCVRAAALILFAVRLMAQAPLVRLWAVGDGVRVDPISGQLIEAHAEIHRDYPAADFRAGNLVWNASSKTVSLKAARNEFVAFQVIVEASEPVAGVDAKFTGLTGPGGAPLDAKYASIFKEWYVRVRHVTTGYEHTSLGLGWYPDALMPYRRATLLSAFPFSFPTAVKRRSAAGSGAVAHRVVPDVA